MKTGERNAESTLEKDIMAGGGSEGVAWHVRLVPPLRRPDDHRDFILGHRRHERLALLRERPRQQRAKPRARHRRGHRRGVRENLKTTRMRNE